jgi:hypothetical protein
MHRCGLLAEECIHNCGVHRATLQDHWCIESQRPVSPSARGPECLERTRNSQANQGLLRSPIVYVFLLPTVPVYRVQIRGRPPCSSDAFQKRYDRVDDEPRVGCRPNETIHAVQNATVIRNQVAEIFDAGIAFDHRSRQISNETNETQ